MDLRFRKFTSSWCTYEATISECPSGSRVRSVGIKMDHGLEGRRIWIRFPAKARYFSLLHSFHIFSGPTQPPIQWVAGSLSPGVKRSDREADNSPPASAEVKKMWIYTSTPQYTFMS
jgi:hypothetical protein